MVSKKLLLAVATLTGTIIGAGILGLPYVFGQSGFPIGVGWLIAIGLLVLLVGAYMGEVTLRTKDTRQLAGYSEKYLGAWGKRLMFFAMIFSVYSADIAYLIGEGESFSFLFTGGTQYTLAFGFLFWLVMAFLLREGLRGLKRVEAWGVGAILGIIVLIFVFFFPSIESANLGYYDIGKLFLPFGVVLFAFLGFTSIPELRRLLRGAEGQMLKAISLGTLVPFIVYLIFTFIFVGVLGAGVEQVATISFGKLVTLFGIFTMMTSFFVLTFALYDMYLFDFKLSKRSAWLWALLVPFGLFLLIQQFRLLTFVQVLGIGGVVSGGIMGILILLMNKAAKNKGDREPEYSLPINWFIIVILSVIFVAGVFFELVL